jgi:hypothetical protein
MTNDLKNLEQEAKRLELQIMAEDNDSKDFNKIQMLKSMLKNIQIQIEKLKNNK